MGDGRIRAVLARFAEITACASQDEVSLEWPLDEQGVGIERVNPIESIF